MLTRRATRQRREEWVAALPGHGGLTPLFEALGPFSAATLACTSQSWHNTMTTYRNAETELRLYRTTHVPARWTRPFFWTSASRVCGVPFLPILAQHYHSLRRVVLDLPFDLHVENEDAWFVALVQRNPLLQHLNLARISERHLGGAGLIAIGANCPALLTLKCQGLGDASAAALGAVGNGCPLLQTLDASDISSLSDDALTSIGRGCPQLKHLKLHLSSRFPGQLFPRPLTQVALTSIGSNCGLLEHLDLGSCYSFSTKFLEGLVSIGHGCPRLLYLDLSKNGDLGSGSLTAIAHNCHLLRELNLDRCCVLDTDLHALASNCVMLRSISLLEAHPIGEGGITALAQQCTHLKVLRVFSGAGSGNSIHSSFFEEFRLQYPHLEGIDGAINLKVK